MHWIKEVERVESIDDLMTSRSNVARTDFSVYDMLDAMIAYALKKASRHACALPKKSNCRRATCSEIRPVLTREANCLHDVWAFSSHRSLWSCTRSIRSFQKKTLTEWWRSRFRYKVGPSSIISKWNTCRNGPGGFIQVRIAGFCSASDCVGNVWNRRIFETTNSPSIPDLKTSVRRHIHQTMRTRNFRAWKETVERGAVTKSQKGKKASAERKVRECYQWTAIGQCS